MVYIGGVALGLSLLALCLKMNCVKVLPLIQIAMVILLGSSNPMMVYIVIATIMGSKGIIKAYKGLRKERYEDGVIANTMMDINNQWYISWWWDITILTGSIFTGTIFGLGVIEGLGKVFLYSSLFISPICWFIYLYQIHQDKGVKEVWKYVIGGLLTSILLFISLSFTFKGVGALGILLPLILLNGKEKGCKKIGNINGNMGITGCGGGDKDVYMAVLVSGIMRTLYVFFSGEALISIINREVPREEDRLLNSFHSEAISEALQPIMLWGFLLSRGGMDVFSQLSMSYILSSQEILFLVLIMLGLSSIFFMYRVIILHWLVEESTPNIPYIDMFVSVLICTFLMGNPIGVLITLGICVVIKHIYTQFKLPHLSKSMSITFVPISMSLL